MDPVSHAVIGRLIARAAARTDPLPRGAAAAAVLGALSPDVDVVLMPIGWDIYLRAHQIGTHSALGALVTGLASAGLVRVAARGSRYLVLAAASSAGALSHLGSDLVSGAIIRPAWPFSSLPAPLPLVAMADPWPIAILAGGLLYLWRGGAPPGLGARRVLLALATFLTLKALLLGLAVGQSRVTERWPPAGDRLIEAQWGSLTEWHVFRRTGSSLEQWTIDAFGHERARLSVPVRPESALVAASRSLDTVRNFLHVHDLGFAVQRPAPGGRQAVLWSDIRFCRREPPGDLQCALWFGGIYERDGRLLTQQVRVGSWIQTRPPPAPPRLRSGG